MQESSLGKRKAPDGRCKETEQLLSKLPESELFSQMDGSRQQSVRSRLELLESIDTTGLRCKEKETILSSSHLIEQQTKKHQQLEESDQAQFERWQHFRSKGGLQPLNASQFRKCHKEFLIMKQYMSGVKSNKLASMFQMDPQQLYKLTAAFKKFLQSTILGSDLLPPPKQPKTLRHDEPNLLLALHSYLSTFGMHNLTLKSLHSYMKANIPQGMNKAPTLQTIHAALKKHFFLTYSKFKTASLKYRDPTFDQKRLWVCRLLSQFLLDDALIISIDETGFRSDTTQHKKWQFISYQPKKDISRPKVKVFDEQTFAAQMKRLQQPSLLVDAKSSGRVAAQSSSK